MKTGCRTSRFGRPQKETQQDFNSIPTEVARFVSKHSPKRLKPKESNLEEIQIESMKKTLTQEIQSIPLENKENFEDNEASEVVKEAAPQEQIPICDEHSTDISAVHIDEKVPETSEFSVAIFEDVPLKSSTDDGLSKQDFSDTDSALGNDIKNNNGEFVAGQVLWGSFSKLSWFPCMAYPIDNDGTVISGKILSILCLIRLHNCTFLQKKAKSNKFMSSTSTGTDSQLFFLSKMHSSSKM